MAVIKCKMCGGDMELSADKTFGTCEYCGSTMTLPKVDDEQRAAAFNRGNHFRRIGEFDKALAVYERIVREDENDAEAHWCCALCRFGIEYVEDPNTYEYLPTCHRASFDNFLEDVDYLAAVEHSDGITRRQYQKDATKIAEVQKGILATSQNEEPFDVFICYKETDSDGNRTRDSIMAQEIYYQLTEQGRRVFFARITLEDKAGTQYEPYIFAALNSAKVMVALGTSEANFNAVWVKNEWSRFLSLMKKDRSKLLLPCYRDMDPYDLPEALSILQSYDMGKIGFMQDLTRGISKVLDAEKLEPVKETVVIQNEGGVNGTALLKRGWMALEDGEWAKADKFFEDVLNQDAECGEAYCGKYFASERCNDMQAFTAMRLHRTETSQEEQKLACERNKQIEDDIIQQYTVPGYLDDSTIRKMLDFPRFITSTVSGRMVQLEKEQQFFEYEKLLVRAVKYASGDFYKQFTEMKKSILNQMSDRVDQATQQEQEDIERTRVAYEQHLAQKCQEIPVEYEKAIKLREHDYQSACSSQNKVKTIYEANALAEKFEALRGYKDSKELAQKWHREAGNIKERELAEIQRMKIAQEEAKKEPDYKDACQRQDKIDTHFRATMLAERFEALGDYKDSKELAIKWRQKAEEFKQPNPNNDWDDDGRKFDWDDLPKYIFGIFILMAILLVIWEFGIAPGLAESGIIVPSFRGLS